MKTLEIGLILACGLGAFASGRLRHDLVAILMLLASVVLGLVPPGSAFSGFADPVVITVAAVMILSAAIARSGILRLALSPLRSVLVSELAIAGSFSILCAVASAFMNNVGALALLLPAALTACRSASVSPSKVLMPMAFASLLGGLATVIGTPPNMIIAELREGFSGQPFGMFDFAPVGATVGVISIGAMLLMLRLIPSRVPAGGEPLLFKISDYLCEVRLLERTRKTPLTVGDLRAPDADGERLSVHAIDRHGIVFAAPGDMRPLAVGDVIQLEGRAPLIQSVIEREGLEIVGGTDNDELEAALFECVVPERTPLAVIPNARLALSQAGAALLAISRSGRSLVERLDKIRIRPGDVLLLQAQEGLKKEIIDKFALLPLIERPLELGRNKTDWRPGVALAAAIIAATLNAAPLAIAFLTAIAALALLGRIDQRAYRDIDWSVILLLAALIPVAHAFSDLGAGDDVAAWLAGFAQGRSSHVIIALVLGLTMLVTPFLNNAAAVLIMAPIAARIGQSTGISVDAMLMAVAVGATCEFLTPIGHQSNTLVMGPGGYRFFDYARFGAPLALVVWVVGTVLIEAVWT